MSDRRYSTAAWQRLRLRVLARDGYWCQIQGPRCRGHANSVHHIIPSSQRPDLFWVVSNLEAACSSCNYGGGARIAAANRRELERTIEQQQATIAELTAALAAATNPASDSARKQPRPAIRSPDSAISTFVTRTRRISGG